MDILIGGIIGFLLGAITVYVRDWQADRRRAEGVRMILEPEVETNLNALEECWDKLRPRKDEDEIHRVDKIVYAREFANAPLPHFSRQRFEGLLPSLPVYLHGRRLAKLLNLYSNLRKIEELHQQLRDALEVDVSSQRGGQGVHSEPGPASPTYDEFLAIAGKSWDQVRYLVEQTLSQGDPIK